MGQDGTLTAIAHLLGLVHFLIVQQGEDETDQLTGGEESSAPVFVFERFIVLALVIGGILSIVSPQAVSALDEVVAQVAVGIVGDAKAVLEDLIETTEASKDFGSLPSLPVRQRVEQLAEIISALERALASGQPGVLDVIVDRSPETLEPPTKLRVTDRY